MRTPVLFVVIALVHLAGEAFMHPLVNYTKPLLMPALALWWWTNSNGDSVRRLILAALLFSCLGDVLLMWSGVYAHYFLLGLGAFLVAHLFYIYVFRRLSRGETGLLTQKPWMVFPFMIFLFQLLALLWPNIPVAMKGAVTVYGLVISTMAASALHLRGILPWSAANWLLLGAILFVLSDSMIAINKFGFPFPESRVAIMSTYIIGQFAIVRGLLMRERRG